jgi:predicted GIY-YIG superfamily endonuclease
VTEPAEKNRTAKTWWVYIASCADGTLYCGSTPDLAARFKAHNEGRGAKYTRGRAPILVAYSKRCRDRSSALKEEARIKSLSRAEKQALIAARASKR